MAKHLIKIATAFLLGLCVALSIAQEEKATFWDTFQPAYAAKDKEAMKVAVMADAKGAIKIYLQLLDKFTVDFDDESGSKIDALREAWSAAFQNRFFEIQYEYLSLIDGSNRSRRAKFLQSWEGMEKIFQSAKGTSNVDGWLNLEEVLPFMVQNFETIGDIYHASVAAFTLAQTFDPEVRLVGANARQAYIHYKEFLAYRDMIDLKDKDYARAQSAIQEFESVFGKPDDGQVGEQGSEGPAIPFVQGSEWKSFSLKTQVTTREAFERFAFDADDLYTTWTNASLLQDSAKKGWSPFTTPTLKPEVDVIRTAPAKYFIDADRDGNGDARIKVIGRPEIVAFELPRDGGKKELYALEFTSGQEKEIIQRVEVNVVPSDEIALLYYRSATERFAEVFTKPLRIFDENCDASFNNAPLDVYQIGMPDFLPVLDSWVYNKEKRATPVSSYTKINDQWYYVDFGDNKLGSEIKLREVVVKEGTLHVEFNGAKIANPVCLIVKAIGVYEGGYFDIAQADKKGVQVPPGKYEIFYGLLRAGKGKQVQKAVILKGNSAPFEVKPGQATTIKIGAPYTLEFAWQRQTDKIVVEGKSVSVRGVLGERYELIWDEVPVPGAQARHAGGKNLGKPVEAKRAEKYDIDQGGDYTMLWHPKDIEIPAPTAGGKIEVQLFIKKHKWFGNMESEWK